MVITTDELSRLAWKTIRQELNPETREILNHMSYTNPEFEQGFIQGVAWLSILAAAIGSDEVKEDDSQRVIAALEGEGYFNGEDEEKYKEAIDKLYKPLGVNVIDEIKPEDC